MDILKVFVILTLVAFPFGEIGRYIFPHIGNTPLLLNDLLIGLTVGIWVGNKLWKKEPVRGKLLVPIMAFLIICITSLLINSMWLSLPQIFISSLYIVRWGVYAGLYFVVREFDAHFKKKLLKVFLIVAHGGIGIGYLQYFFFPSLKSLYHLGWDEHLYRMFSVFLDPNFAGVIFVLVFILTAGLAVQSFHEKNMTKASWLFIFSFFDLLAVYLTYSRSALLMLLVSILLFLWLYGKIKYILVVFILFIAFLLLSPKSFQTEGTNIFRMTSSEARLESAKNAWDIYSKHPLFGVGFNAYRYAQNKYGYISGPYWIVSHGGGGTDNSFLFVLATTGVVGFSLFAFLWYRIIRYERALLATKEKRILAIITITSILGVFISAFFINSLFYVFVMEWLWILIGLTSQRED